MQLKYINFKYKVKTIIISKELEPPFPNPSLFLSNKAKISVFK